MELTKYFLTVLAGYLLGSMSVSILVSSRIMGGDVRTKGSGNAGATNMARVYGWSAGVLTLAGDALKAAVSMVIGYILLGDYGLAAGGIACIIGHCYPVYHCFKGGKGVSVGAAIALAIDWRVFVAVAVTFFVVAFISKKVSLGSVCGAVMITVASALFGETLPKLILAIVSMILVVFQHRENLKRLYAGTEPDFKAGKRKKED